MARGCYGCLEQAFGLASAATLDDLAFETALLLALRSKELGLPHGAWFAHARPFVATTPHWQTYLDIALSVPLDPLSGDRDAVLLETAAHRRPRPVLEGWRQALAAGGASPAFRAYLDLSLVCGPLLYGLREDATAAVLQQFPDVPLLHYRAGLCGQPSRLREVVGNDPGFHDVELELGRTALQRERADSDEALEWFRSARIHFPASPTIAAAVATLLHEQEAWDEALAAYETTLRLVPSHRDALLGATISLSHLGRHDEAIARASTIIELGSWFMADAHYWRAWNAYQERAISAARDDVDRAKALEPNPATLVLSGIVAWSERRLDFAGLEFEAALNRDANQCDAAMYLGGVRAEQQRWVAGVAAFQQAQECFDASIAIRRKAIAELTASERDAHVNARQIGSHERAILDAERRRDQAVESAAAVRRQMLQNSVRNAGGGTP